MIYWKSILHINFISKLKCIQNIYENIFLIMDKEYFDVLI